MGILTRATKNLSRRKTRAIIVIVALSLALTLLTILPPSINTRENMTRNALNDLVSTGSSLKGTVNLAATEIDGNFGTNFTVLSFLNGDYGNISGTQISSQYLTVNITDYSGLSSIPDVTTVIPILEQGDPQLKYGSVWGIPVNNASFQMDSSLLPANITEGRNLQVGDTGVVVLDEKDAALFNVTVGGTITLSGLSLKVIGIEGTEGGINDYQGATMSLADAQAITNTTSQASDFKIFADNVDNVDTITSRIEADFPKMQVSSGESQLNTAAPLESQLNTMIQAAQSNLNQIQNTGLVEIALAVVADAAIILFIMLYSVRERTKEIGTLKAMGASDASVLGQFMLEGVILSVIAAVIAIVVGAVVVPTFASMLLPTPTQVGASVGRNANGTMVLGRTTFGLRPFLSGNGPNVFSVPVTPVFVLTGLGTAVLLGALGSLYPALKAARTRPAEAMRYE